MDLINRNEVLDFLEENFGFWEYIRLIKDNYEVDEATALSLADEVKDAIKNVIESMETIEKREQATLHVREYYDDWGDYQRPYYLYHCNSCFESVKQEYSNEDFKFCPHCGAQYDIKIVEDK